MPVSKADQFRLLDRRRRVAERYLSGVLQYRIAEEEKVHKGQITRDLGYIRDEWRWRYAANYDEFQQCRWQRILQELAKLDLVEAEAWAAWERSKADRERTVAEKIAEANGRDRTKASKQVEARLPEADYLRIIQWCVNRRCQLLALDPPTKTEITGKDGEAVAHVHYYIPDPGRGPTASQASQSNGKAPTAPGDIPVESR